MSKKLSLIVFLGLLLLSLLTGQVVEAGIQPGVPTPADFQYKGIALGDTTQEMTAKLGEPLFDGEAMFFDLPVKCYTYSSQLRVYTDRKSDTIVGISCKDKEYVAPKGVRYGATRAKLLEAYGPAEHQNLDGMYCYLYRNPLHPKQKLILSLDTTNYYLLSFNITSLPVTEDEMAEAEGFLASQEEAEAPQEDITLKAGWHDDKGMWFNAQVTENVSVGN